MNYHQISKKEKHTQQRALLLAFFLHLILLGGLYYFNAEDPAAIIPDFVTNWFKADATESVAIVKSKESW